AELPQPAAATAVPASAPTTASLLLTPSSVPLREREMLRDRHPDRLQRPVGDDDRQVLGEHDLSRIGLHALAVRPDHDVLLAAGAIAAQAARREAEAPDVEELAEREAPVHGRLDVD